MKARITIGGMTESGRYYTRETWEDLLQSSVIDLVYTDSSEGSPVAVVNEAWIEDTQDSFEVWVDITILDPHISLLVETGHELYVTPMSRARLEEIDGLTYLRDVILDGWLIAPSSTFEGCGKVE